MLVRFDLDLVEIDRKQQVGVVNIRIYIDSADRIIYWTNNWDANNIELITSFCIASNQKEIKRR
jgi:hypothetical protein